MKRTTLGLIAIITIAIATFTGSAQQTPDRVRALPGDRPAANIHATRSAVFGRNGMIATSQPMASAAGLKDTKVRFEHRTMRAPNPAEFGMGFVQASPVAGKFLALTDEDKQRFGEFIADRLASYVDDAGMAVPQENHFLTARK